MSDYKIDPKMVDAFNQVVEKAVNAMPELLINLLNYKKPKPKKKRKPKYDQVIDHDPSACRKNYCKPQCLSGDQDE